MVTLFLALSVSAQEVIATQGDLYSTPAGNICFTIGETIISTATDGTNTITQGFHQNSWRLVGIENHFPNYDVNIFPNPTEDILNIQTSTFEEVTYTLMDAQGKILMSDKLISNLTSIAVSQYAPGTYVLQLSKDSQNLRSFKLIKSY